MPELSRIREGKKPRTMSSGASRRGPRAFQARLLTRLPTTNRAPRPQEEMGRASDSRARES